MKESLHPGTTLAERIRYLFEVRRHESGRRYSANEVVAVIRESAAKSTINKLRNDPNANPTRQTLIGLAIFFDVPIAYFFPELEGRTHKPLPGWSSGFVENAAVPE